MDCQLDQEFALAVHARTMSRLEEKYSKNDQKARFEQLQQFVLGNDSGASYAEVATRLAMNPNSVKKAVFDLRELYCDFFHAEVAETVARESIEEEMRYLLTILANAPSIVAP